MSEPSDQSLIEAARAGDGRAFACLLERHYAMIYRVAYRWCGDRADAEDVAQDVCVKLGQAIRGFKGNASFATWLYRLTLNAARDLGRARARRERHVAAMALVAEPHHRPDPERDLTGDQLWAAVQDLPAKQRDAVLLVFGEDLSHGQAAAVMGCRESTVSWHIHTAKKTLQRLL